MIFLKASTVGEVVVVVVVVVVVFFFSKTSMPHPGYQMVRPLMICSTQSLPQHLPITPKKVK